MTVKQGEVQIETLSLEIEKMVQCNLKIQEAINKKVSKMEVRDDLEFDSIITCGL